MLSLGQLVKAIHDLRVKVGMARKQTTYTSDTIVQLSILTKVLDEVEKELERIAD